MCSETGPSPIPLTCRESKLNKDKDGIKFENYEQTLKNWFITNTGCVVKVAPKEFIKCPQAPTISGYGLPGRFVAQNFHFHWGSNNCQGAVHTLEGSRHAMEVHILHVNEKYSSLEEAKDKTDGMALIGLVYFVAPVAFDKDPYKCIADQLSHIIEPNTTTPLLGNFRLSDIIERAYMENYFAYNGSFITPPYRENISWIVIGHPIRVSEYVLLQLRKLKGPGGKSLSDNFRPIQEIGNRTVRSVVTY